MPLYHTLYETFHLARNLYDPEMEYNVALTRTWALVAYFLSNLSLPPRVGREKERQGKEEVSQGERGKERGREWVRQVSNGGREGEEKEVERAKGGN